MRTRPPKSARVCNSDVLRMLRFLRVPEVCFEVCPWNPVLHILRVLRVMRVFFATFLQQAVPPSTFAGQQNVYIQKLMQITRPPKPKPKPKPKPGTLVAKRALPPKTRCINCQTSPEQSKTSSQT